MIESGSSIGQLLDRILSATLTRILIGVGIVAVCAFLSYKAAHNQATETMILTEDRVSLTRYLDGTASRPFAYRALTPILIRFTQNTLNIPGLAHFLPDIAQQKIAYICSKATADPAPSCDSVVSYFVVSAGYFFVFLLSIFFITQRLFGRSLAISAGAILLAFWITNAIILLRLSHIYDFGVLMFGTLLLICLEYRTNVLFCMVLALACLNKESSIIYSLAFVFVNMNRMSLPKLATYFAGQLLAFAVIYGCLNIYFGHNEGAGLEFWLWSQISLLTEKLSLPDVLLLVTAAIVVFYRFPEKNQTLRMSSIVIIPWFLLFMVGGVPRELRVMFEILPLLLLMATDSAVALVLGTRPVRLSGA